jgi:two-component system sensor histidine kinase KdpD
MGAMGSDVAVQSADVALMGTDLGRLPQAMRLAQQTRAVVNQNVLFAIGGSLAIMTLAGLGLISPVVGAVVQNVGTVAVVVNSGRLLRFDDAETERLRNSLLSAVSHDLRTPLATITGSASALVEQEAGLDATARRELAQAIDEEADRLNRLVQNLLEMTRLESGGIRVGKDWEPLEEVVGSALVRMEKRLGDRRVDIQLTSDLPLVPLDPLLIEQVLINILDNAIKYTPAGSPIEISASIKNREVEVVIADRGPGLAPGDETLVFEKFYRGHPAGTRRGAGLGLAIARGIVEAHGGRILAEPRPGGGALFRFFLPLAAEPPEVRIDDA